MSAAMDDTTIETAVMFASAELGYASLKDRQKEVITEFISGRDVFAALPTGYGKSLCYGCLPQVYDQLRSIQGSIVVVVSPLSALMKDQVESFRKRGISAALVTSCSDEQMKIGVVEGRYQLVFISPEQLISRERFRSMCRNDCYTERLAALVVDEAHCVKKWGDEFRREFSRLGELRSLLPRHVHILAMTATATASLRRSVIKTLGMKDPAIINENIDKPNLVYTVLTFESIENTFNNMIQMLKRERKAMPRTIIYCQLQDKCAQLYLQMKMMLGEERLEPIGAPDLPEFRLFDYFTSATHESVKDEILKTFTQPTSSLRIVIATIAFGMGIDTPDIRYVIHWGPPHDVEQYVQATGRAGRDGNTSYAILLYSKGLKRHVEEAMLDYCKNSNVCRRRSLFCDFDSFVFDPSVSGCRCCDICSVNCSCGNCQIQNMFT